MRLALILSILVFAMPAAARPRARQLGIPFDGTPGPNDAITDVAGVEVGHTTLIQGNDVRTGVSAILPRGKRSNDPVFGAWFSMNGNGEMTGTTWLEESGVLSGPVMLTNTHAVGVVHDAVIAWQLKRGPVGDDQWSLPVVAETWDATLNDINGFHVKAEHAMAALDNATSGAVSEGAVGGGTGMECLGWKGGIGTASRVLTREAGGYVLGVLVQCNFGLREQLRIAGIPLGEELSRGSDGKREKGSIIVVIATDAPLLPHQLKRIARRAALGLGRVGSIAGDGSGDIFVAFSTANAGVVHAAGPSSARFLPNDRLDALFAATVAATEEAVVNTLVAGQTMTGFEGHTVEGLPIDRVRAILKRHDRLRPPR